MTLGLPNPKGQKWERGWEERSGEEGRIEWETLPESQGNGFEQRSAGSALTFLAKNEINLKNSQKAQRSSSILFATWSNWLLPCPDCAKFGS